MESSMSLSAKNLYFPLCRSEGICYLQLHRHLRFQILLTWLKSSITGANASEAYFILAHSIK
jgi:hypothetical protein